MFLGGCWRSTNDWIHNRRTSRNWRLHYLKVWDELPQDAVKKSITSFHICVLASTLAADTFLTFTVKVYHSICDIFCVSWLAFFSAFQTCRSLKFVCKMVLIWFLCLCTWKNHLLCLKLCCFCKTEVEMLKFVPLMAKCLTNNLWKVHQKY